MTSKVGSGRAVTLAIERLTQTAIIDGEVVDLPPREFALLSELAARPGTPIHTKKLVPVVWPDTAGMTSQDLYVVISTLRKRIGDHERHQKLVRTERRFGYYVALPPEQVLIADDLDKTFEEQVIRLEPETSEQATGVLPVPEPAVAVPAAAPQPKRVPPDSRRMLQPALVAIFVLLAVAGSWSAGYVISSQLERGEQAPTVPDTEPTGPVAEEETVKGRNSESTDKARRNDGRRGKTKNDAEPRQRQRAPGAVAAPPIASAPQAPTSGSEPASASGQQQPAKKPKPQPAPLPPAPTRFLYHLVNQESGDHFVTTDGNVSSQYQARGYEGGAIGRVYNSAVEGTRAISTNQGTAYIFIRSDTKTEPASRPVTLWYSSNNSGDFFYTTNEAEAKQTGWSASVVGYVGAL